MFTTFSLLLGKFIFTIKKCDVSTVSSEGQKLEKFYRISFVSAKIFNFLRGNVQHKRNPKKAQLANALQ